MVALTLVASAVARAEPRIKHSTVRVADQKVRVATRYHGHPDAKTTLLCLHGLTRNGADFDALAKALAGRDLQVIAPDIVGRGQSGWLNGEGRHLHYNLDTNAAQVEQTVDQDGLSGKKTFVLGTSMGGFTANKLARRGRIRLDGVILNDVGPNVSASALKYLAKTLKGETGLVLRDRAATVRYVEAKYAGFGLQDRATWEAIADSSFVHDPGKGGFVVRYDPAITALVRETGSIKAFVVSRILTAAALGDWEAVRSPVLVLRGGSSPILDPDTVRAMVESKGQRNVEVATFDGTPAHPIGHAPLLNSSDQIHVVRDWLRRHQ